MSKRQWLCLFGVWFSLFLFLGFPSSWHKPIAVISGLIIVGISYNIPHERKTNKNSESAVFAENDNHQ